MIRRLARELLDEANLPPEVREIFFPTPPEISAPRPPVTPPVRPEAPTGPEVRDRERIRPEAASLERIESRPREGDTASARRALVESGSAAQRQPRPVPVRNLLRSRATLQQAILVQEILGPPKALQEESDPFAP